MRAYAVGLHKNSAARWSVNPDGQWNLLSETSPPLSESLAQGIIDFELMGLNQPMEYVGWAREVAGGNNVGAVWMYRKKQ